MGPPIASWQWSLRPCARQLIAWVEASVLRAGRFEFRRDLFDGDAEFAFAAEGAPEEDFGLDREAALRAFAFLWQRAVRDDFAFLLERRADLDVDRFHGRERRAGDRRDGRDERLEHIRVFARALHVVAFGDDFEVHRA